jgi:hypothetical protein
VDINLHMEAPELADKVGSVYFVAHARQADDAPLPTLVTNAWRQQLDDLPSWAEANGGPRLRMISFFAFTLRQNLELDDWKCGDRCAHFELLASLHQDGYSSASVGTTSVDSGWGDAWGCRSKLEGVLKATAADVARDLTDGLNAIWVLVGDHPPLLPRSVAGIRKPEILKFWLMCTQRALTGQ